MTAIVMKVAPSLNLTGHRLAGYLDWVANTLEPDLRDQYLQTVEALNPSVKAVADAIQAGGSPFTPAVEAAIAHVTLPIGPLHSLALQAYALGGATGHTLAHPKFHMSFDLTSPRAQSWADAHMGALVKYVTEPARDSLRTALSTAYRANMSVDATAHMIQDHQLVGLLPQHSAAVVRYRQGLVNQGLSPQRIQAMTDRYTNKLLNYRAWNIARTEILGSAHAGQMDFWRSAMDAGFIAPDTQREWLTRLDERACPVCKGLDGTTASMDGQFYGTTGASPFMPPAHPSCRCSMSLVITLLKPAYLTNKPNVPVLTGYPTNPRIDVPTSGKPQDFLGAVLAGMEGQAPAVSTGAAEAGMAVAQEQLAGLTNVADVLTYLGVYGASRTEQVAAVGGFLATYGDMIDGGLRDALSGLGGIAKFNANHEPAGSPKGGQFAQGKGGGSVAEFHIGDEDPRELAKRHGLPDGWVINESLAEGNDGSGGFAASVPEAVITIRDQNGDHVGYVQYEVVNGLRRAGTATQAQASISMISVNPSYQGNDYADVLMDRVYEHLGADWTDTYRPVAVYHHSLLTPGQKWLKSYLGDRPKLWDHTIVEQSGTRWKKWAPQVFAWRRERASLPPDDPQVGVLTQKINDYFISSGLSKRFPTEDDAIAYARQDLRRRLLEMR